MLRRAMLCLTGVLFSLALAAPVLAAGSDADKMNPLSLDAVQSDLAIWTVVVFVVLFVVLKRFAWGPLADGLDKRENQIASQIAQAEEANRQAKELLASYEKKLVDARDEVRDIVEQGRHAAEQLGRELTDKAKADARAEQQRGIQQIEAATAAAVKELADRSAAMAVDLAGKIIHVQIKSSDHAQLIEQAVAGFVHSKPDAHLANRN